MGTNIINWNCRGFKKNIDEIKMILKDYDPVVLCCQETYTKTNNTINFRKYVSYHTHAEAIDGSVLQAVAVSLSMHKTITLCSVYIPPSYALDNRELDNLLEQLPSPFILLGDMNARNTDWGNPDTNSKGHRIEKIIKDHELCLWNDGNPTFIHPATGSFSAIDLSICSPSLFMDFNWVVHDDLCGSDHFPTF